MKFEYVGYRPIISHHGITFKQGKDDKFVYFPYVYEILNSLNHEYTTNKNRYSTSINLENASIDKLYKIVEKYFPTLHSTDSFAPLAGAHSQPPPAIAEQPFSPARVSQHSWHPALTHQ